MTEDVVKLVPAILPNRMQLAEQVRNVWNFTVPNEATLEDFLRPAYWAHVSATLRPRDRLEVETEDGSYLAEFIVLDCGRQYAKVVLLNEWKLDSMEPGADAPLPDHSVKWSGRATKWRVLRESDSKVIREGFATKADAYGWLAGYAKSVAA